MATIFAYPPVPFALSIGTIVLILGFTSPSSPLRPLGIIPLIIYVRFVIWAVKDTEITPTHMSILVGGTAGMMMQYLDSVLLSRWSYEAQGPTSALGGQKHLRAPSSALQRMNQSNPGAFFSRLKFGWEEAARARSTRTPWQVNHVPEFFPNRPGEVPTKKEFLYRMVREFLIGVFILDVMSWMGQDASMNSVYFAPNRVPFFTRLRDVTLDEMTVRIIASVIHWVAGFYQLQVIYTGTAVTLITFGLGRVERWPPLFGQLKECWSIRQFWGTFWHQAARQRFVAPANFLVFSIMRLPRGTLVARYGVLGLTFMISGVFHLIFDVALGMRWQESGALRFFTMQALGIIIEDAAQGIFRRAQSHGRSPGWFDGWKSVVGSVWLLLWLVWTTPDWGYAIARRSSGQSILPFSLLGWLV